jgi:predicted AAA+ superfamily ATPase
MPTISLSADAITSANTTWISQNWEVARFTLANSNAESLILVIDEIQKIENWSDTVKKEWDADTKKNINIKLVLLGSAKLLIDKGLSESLAGRFETIKMTHWSFEEMQEAFDFTVEEFVYFGGYPGAASLIKNEKRWKEYIKDSLIETTLSKDILMMNRIDKPMLLRRLFELGCSYSGQILSFTKILGQLQDSGNSTTLSHYMGLFDSAGLMSGIDKYAPGKVRQRGSIPKWQSHNSAFSTVFNNLTLKEVQKSPEIWGRYVETAIGVHLMRAKKLHDIEVFYWREGNDEIDFVISDNKQVIGLEVKSGRNQRAKGADKFAKTMKHDKMLLVGNSGIAWQDFLKADIRKLF